MDYATEGSEIHVDHLIPARGRMGPRCAASWTA